MDTCGNDSKIGWLSWEILDAVSRRKVVSGARDIYADEVEEVVLSEKMWPDYARMAWPFRVLSWWLWRTPVIRRQVHLAEGFYICLHASPAPERSDLRGFGLSARRTHTPTLSWEWFTFEGDTSAVKLQEAGRLAVRVDRTDAGWELLHTRFLTDVSLRIAVNPVGCLPGIALIASGIRPHWRVVVKESSYIDWPSIASLRRPIGPPN